MVRLALALGALLAVCLGLSGAAQPSTSKQTVDPILVECDSCSAFEWSGIYTMRPDGSHFRLLLPRLCRKINCGYAGARWSPDGSRLVVMRTSAAGPTPKARAGIWTLRPNDRGLKRVTSNQTDSPVAWSPDGRKILFLRRLGPVHNYITQLWVVDANGRHPHPLTRDLNVYGADWSTSGDRVAFSIAPIEGVSSWLYVVGANGKGLRRLPWRGELPRWSPDGKRLAFTSRTGSGAIPWFANVLTLRENHVRTINVDLASPGVVWAPSGKALLVGVWDRNAPDNNYNVTLLSLRDAHQEVLLPNFESAGAFATDWRR